MITQNTVNTHSQSTEPMTLMESSTCYGADLLLSDINVISLQCVEFLFIQNSYQMYSVKLGTELRNWNTSLDPPMQYLLSSRPRLGRFFNAQEELD